MLEKGKFELLDTSHNSPKSLSTVLVFVPHCFIHMFVFSIYVKEVKIAIGDDVLLCSWFCVVNLYLGKFGPRPGGG